MSDKINNVAELENKLSLESRERAKTIIDDIFENISIPNINTLPEQVFINTFLPLFHGDVIDDQQRMMLTQQWINISGGPSQEVSVVNEKNEELYKVPPIFNSSAVTVSEKGRKSISDIIKENEYDDFKPRALLNLVNDLDVRQKELLVNVEQARVNTVDTLNNIFTRYNLSSFKNDNKSKDVDSDNDLTYDD